MTSMVLETFNQGLEGTYMDLPEVHIIPRSKYFSETALAL